MNKKALYAVMLALLLPLTAYFIVKRKSETAVTMPRHYLPDSVVSVTKNGKRAEDTAWHRLADFTLTNQEGRPVSWDSLKGKIIIADFFFTHCPTICPRMTLNMKRMAESIHNGQRVGDKTNKQVHFLSFSIDPERDSVERLKYWADKYQVNPEQWWLLTGDKKAIYDLVIEEMKVGLVDGKGVDTNFIHSDRFVLIDSNRHVRGYYNGLDSEALTKLSNDLVLLTMEKDPRSKSFFDGKLQLIAVVFLLAIFGVGLLFFFIRKK
ncbi:MAG: SCO family protein [Chitinophagaceae bacterium]|nr:SCO family protein [Chitinophagaceae bacterium]MBK9569966.1 SCO family protein [Chitinophagaceae bacterium]MBL0130884.1 SCO family protein [Chitinophagaceae bacterium]MBL0272817.1 SCO family protein [Chitinophagaceae bacterium]